MKSVAPPLLEPAKWTGRIRRVTFKYDPFGRRIYKQSSQATSIFVYDGDNLAQTVNAAGSTVARYTETQNIDEPLAMQQGTTTDYYDADGLGSITSLTSGTGSLSQTYTFDSFGRTTASSGSLTNPLQDTARELDAETNLYYYRARYYDPVAGRFNSEDPISFGGGSNFYDYVQNSPIGHSDPFGLRAKPAPPGLIVGIQNLFPGSTFDGTTLTIPGSCLGVMKKLRAQGYQDANSWGWNGPLSAFWNPIHHAGGSEWRTFGPGFHFRMQYPAPQPYMGKCDGPCKLDQFHIDEYNPIEPGQMWQHVKCDFFGAC